MKRSLLILTGFSSLMFAACGSSGGSAGDGSAPGDGSTVTGDTAVINPGDGAMTADTAMTADGAAGADQAPGIDMGTTSMDPGLPAMADHACLNGPVANDDGALYFGLDTTCTITQVPMPPVTPMQKMAFDYACGFYGGPAKVVDNCPRDNIVAYCYGQGVGPGTKGWKLIYKSKVTPDAEAVALNAIQTCGTNTIHDASGALMPARTCKGTITAKVNGVDKVFDKNRVCTFKNNGTKAQYFAVGDTATGDRLTLFIERQNGMYTFGNSILAASGYLEGGAKAFTVGNPAMQMIQVSKFEDKGAAITGTFTIGELKNAAEVRTITDGVLDVSIVTP
jgi:hypothetical protein